MCVFCAAIPVTLAVGASAQQSQQKNAIINGLKRTAIPVKTVTAVVVAGLVVGSVVTHTRGFAGF